MAGFTAVNEAAECTGLVVPAITNQALDTTTPSTTSHGQGPSVVSHYLGRGNPNVGAAPVKQCSGPFRGRGSRKNRSKAQRVATISSDESSTKRRKLSQVSDAMPVSKMASRMECPSTGAFARTTNQLKNLGQCTVSTVRATMSACAISTSMASFHAGSPQTSIDAVRSTAGHGTTVYDSTTSPQRLNPHREPQSTSKRCAEARHHGSSSANAMKAKGNAAGSAPISQVSSVDRRTSIILIDRPMKSSAGRSETAAGGANSASIHGRGRPTTNIITDANEDFIDEDDEAFAKAFELVEQAATDIEREPRKTISALGCVQSAGGIPIETRKKNVKEGEVNSLRRLTPDKDIMESTNCEELDILELMRELGQDQHAEVNADSRPWSPSQRDRRLNSRDVDSDEDYGGAFLSDADRRLLVHSRGRQDRRRKPIVRKAFPDALLDRSAISGASNATVLRTCFRLGEALNNGAQAGRMKQHVVLELYARVASSYREHNPNGRQLFVFKDLHHSRPPYLHGTFESWNQSHQQDRDSKALLGPRKNGIMCRVVGKMKRDMESKKWRMEILSICEASWEDVDFVVGIYEDAPIISSTQGT